MGAGCAQGWAQRLCGCCGKAESASAACWVQIGYKEVPARKLTKPELGHLQKAELPPLKHLREFKVGVGRVEGPGDGGWEGRCVGSGRKGGGRGVEGRQAGMEGCSECRSGSVGLRVRALVWPGWIGRVDW